MRKKIIALMAICIVSISMTFAYGESGQDLKPFESMMKEFNGVYELYEDGKIKTYNKSIELKNNDKFTLNTIIADKTRVILMYTIEGKDPNSIEIYSNNLRPYGGEGVYSSFSKSNTIGNSTYIIQEYNANVVLYNDTLDFVVSDESCIYGYISFKECDFVQQYVDFKPNIKLENVNISRITSSPLGITILIESKEGKSKKEDSSYYGFDFRNIIVSSNSKVLKNYRAGSVLLSNDVFLNYATYNRIDRAAKKIIININNKDHEIQLSHLPNVCTVSDSIKKLRTLDFSISEGEKNVPITTNLVVKVKELIYTKSGELLTNFDESDGYIKFLRGNNEEGDAIEYEGKFDPNTLEITISPQNVLNHNKRYFVQIEDGQLYYADGKCVEKVNYTFATKKKPIVQFNDPKLESAVRSALGKLTGDIKDTDMLNLQEFTARNLGITDLTGLEYAVYLKEIDLSSNNISDITPLKNCIYLYGIDLARNNISDITILKNLTNVNVIDISSNNIGDIKPLKNLHNLNTLYTSDNIITNIEPLMNLEDLRVLSIMNNPIDIRPKSKIFINELKNKGVSVGISTEKMIVNQIIDIYFKDHNLEAAIRNELSKPTGKITNLDMLKLKYLYKSQFNIKDLTGLEYAINLEELHLHGNQIKGINQLENLTKLKCLNLSNNQISDITALSNLNNLKEIYIWGNEIKDITPLNNLTNLTFINLSNNRISDITPLNNLTNLESLYISGNEISNIYLLSNLTNLKELDICDIK